MVMSKFIFKKLVITHPKNSCESRASLGLPRPRCAATSPPHSSPSLSLVNNGCRAQLGERGALYVGLPGTDRSLPGMAGNRKKWKSQCTTQQLGLYQRICCCTLLYCCSTSWVGRLVRRWVVGWVDDRVYSWLWVFDVLRTFVFWAHGAFATLSRRRSAVRTSWIHIYVLLL